MEHLPHLLIEGLIISCFALGVKTCYIYVRGEFKNIIGILQKAINEAYQHKFLGENILGTGCPVDIFIHPGAGAYICGEETGLLESLEGKQGNPRIKPHSRLIKVYMDARQSLIMSKHLPQSVPLSIWAGKRMPA